MSMRVMADHSRATAYLIADGVLPSNEGRGYVLRRIMRRAMRHAKMLGFEDPVLFKTASFVLDFMASAYPAEAQRKAFVAKVVENEEERFIATLGNGLRILQDEVAQLKQAGQTVIPGETVFKLYDTYGFPVDLTADIVEKDGYSLDEAGFETCMDAQRSKAREHWKGSGEEAVAAIYKKLVDQGIKSTFTGYDKQEDQGEVLALIKDNQLVQEAVCGETVEVITAVTPCYGESGGQVGDTGEMSTAEATLRIIDTKKPLDNLFVHICEVVTGAVKQGAVATVKVDAERRQKIVLNHTATHLLQAAMQKILGDHIKQAGSLVEPDRLRFDFTHFSPVTGEELIRIEEEVNAQIRANAGVTSQVMAADEAQAAGAMALFGEKYGDQVRVISVGDYSMELCGGTHAKAAGDIGLFRILSEGGIAAGVRRIEATTGDGALAQVHHQQQTLQKLADLVKSDPQQLEARLAKMVERQKEMERELAALESRLKAGQADDIMSQVEEINGVKVLAAVVDPADGKGLRDMADKLRDKIGSGIVAIGCPFEGKVNLLVAVTKDLTEKLHAGKLVGALAVEVGGRGGGRPDLAQAGGSQPEKLTAALEKVGDMVRSALG